MLEVDRKQFTRAIDLAATVVERRNTIPVLGALKATANGSLALEGSNLDTFTRVELPCNGDAAAFVLCEPRNLRRAVNSAGGEAVLIKPAQGEKEDRLVMEAGPLVADVHALPHDDHPGAEPIVTEEFAVDIGTAELKQIARVMRAVSTEETRYYLNGICVKKVDDWTWRFAATDGHRLMMADIPLPGAVGTLPDGIIIPRGWLNIALVRFARTTEAARLSFGYAQLANAPSAADMSFTPRGPRIALSGAIEDLRFTLTGKLIDGTFPDYMRVVPAETPVAARFKRADLVQAIRALSPFGVGHVRAVKLCFVKDGINLELRCADFGTGRFSIAAEHNAPKDFEIGFNGNYLLDVCAAYTGEELEFGMTDFGGPTVITDPADTAFRAVQMPMRV